MASSFDPYEESSWYFGPIGRKEATGLLLSEKEGGVFLVRDSASCVGDYVLCVKEDSKVSHYIINKMQQSDQVVYRIGDQVFQDLPSLLSFYKLHYLDTTPLIRPAVRKIEKVIAKHNFDGQDQDDLSFKKGEILTIISKDEEQWWTAMNSEGKKGSIPVPYVHKYVEESNSPTESMRPPPTNNMSEVQQQAEAVIKRNQMQRKLPAKAKVKQLRVPNAYDKTALRLEVGDIITVTKTNINGQWEGELNGKTGYFPFTHVEFIDDNREVAPRFTVLR